MVPAAATQEPRPVPGGWLGPEMAAAPQLWRLPVPAGVRADLLTAAASIRPGSVGNDPFTRLPPVSGTTHRLIADVRRRLAGDPGFVVLTGFPVAEGPDLTAAAYWVMGLLLGRPLRQTMNGDLMARVENVGRDASSPGGQGYRLPIALGFHADRCTDLISLLCVRPAQSGGLSSLLSCKKIYQALREQDPELLSVLCEPLPFSVPPLRVPAGCSTPPWCMIPVFSLASGQFAAHYIRRFFDQAQDFADAPRLTPRQLSALNAAEEVTARAGLPLEMTLQAGDVQIINNLHVLHARTAYHDEPPERGRLLLRLHLAFSGSPALPDSFSPLFGATSPGVYRGGVWRTGEEGDRLGMPLGAASAA